MRGAPYYVDTDFVRNQFLVRLVNKQMEPLRFVLRAGTLPDKAVTNGFDQPVEVGPMSEEVRPFIVQVPRSSYRGGFAVSLEIADEPGTFKLKHEVEFLGPDAKLLKEDGAK